MHLCMRATHESLGQLGGAAGGEDLSCPDLGHGQRESRPVELRLKGLVHVVACAWKGETAIDGWCTQISSATSALALKDL